MSRYWPALLLVLLVGCNNAGDELSSSKPSTSGSPVASETGGPSPSNPDPKVTLRDIPADLQSDAYHYFGFSYTKSIPMSVSQTDKPKRSGEVVTKLLSVASGEANFEVVYSGGLSDLGTNNLRLAKDGVHATSTSMGKISGDDMELPANLTPGRTWRSKTRVETSSGDIINQDFQFKVVGIKPLKTAVASYAAALCITCTGTMTSQGQHLTVRGKAWYVKDRGAVRQELTQQPEKGRPVSLTIEEAKPS